VFVGHYGPAFGLKRWAPAAPMWSLAIGVQLVDVVWALLVPAGVEKIRITPGFTASNSLDLQYIPFTHGLTATIGWAAMFGIAIWLVYKQSRAGVAAGLAVFSHWIADYLVHVPDLPLFGNQHKVGLGLWNYKWPTYALELAVLGLGMLLYVQGTKARDRIGKLGPPIFFVVLAVMQIVNNEGAPKSPNGMAIGAFVSFLGVAAVATWIDRHREVT